MSRPFRVPFALTRPRSLATSRHSVASRNVWKRSSSTTSYSNQRPLGYGLVGVLAGAVITTSAVALKSEEMTTPWWKEGNSPRIVAEAKYADKATMIKVSRGPNIK